MTFLLVILGIIVCWPLSLSAFTTALSRFGRPVIRAWSDIEVQLKQRQDLVPQLVNTVKGYAAHEKETFEEVVGRARQAAVSANSVKARPPQKACCHRHVGNCLRWLKPSGIESQPELSAIADELSDVENKIRGGAAFLQQCDPGNNTGREQFPAVLIAGPFGFEAREFFEAPEGREALQEPVEVQF